MMSSDNLLDSKDFSQTSFFGAFKVITVGSVVFVFKICCGQLLGEDPGALSFLNVASLYNLNIERGPVDAKDQDVVHDSKVGAGCKRTVPETLDAFLKVETEQPCERDAKGPVRR